MRPLISPRLLCLYRRLLAVSAVSRITKRRNLDLHYRNVNLIVFRALTSGALDRVSVEILKRKLHRVFLKPSRTSKLCQKHLGFYDLYTFSSHPLNIREEIKLHPFKYCKSFFQHYLSILNIF